MKLSFDDEDSYMEVVGSLCFNNPPSDLNSETQALDEVGSSSSHGSSSSRSSSSMPMT